jgi:probable rRNA maturation factor
MLKHVIIFATSVDGVSTAALDRFARRAQKLARVRGEVDVLIADDARLRELNRRYRGKNQPTDVLSFPRPNGAEQRGGDIAISAQIARFNARRYGHSTADELKILVLHGMLHLAGYDHKTDDGRMRRLEARLRSELGLPASLIERAHSSKRRARKAGSSRSRS